MLGDLVERALSLVGVTQERVERWVGGPCGCEERKQKLNQLGYWVARVLSGKRDRAEQYLEQIMEE